MSVFDWIGGEAFRQVEGRVLHVTAANAPQMPFAAVDPDRLRVEVEAGVTASLVVLHNAPNQAVLDLRLAEGASLEVTEVFASEAFVECTVRQQARSRCSMVTVLFSSANVRYRAELDGPDAECGLDGVFVAGGAEHCVLELRTAHNAPDCRSRSTVKGVAGGSALCEFRGLVYVAPGAQRTDARQQSRNVLLGPEARIDTRPQLEIYADDVKCTHGATVGMMDSDAILYMRQRGLSLRQARSLQIEGFVNDVLLRCPFEAVRAAMIGAVTEKLEKI